jgi:hypothetical protein
METMGSLYNYFAPTTRLFPTRRLIEIFLELVRKSVLNIFERKMIVFPLLETSKDISITKKEILTYLKTLSFPIKEATSIHALIEVEGY